MKLKGILRTAAPAAGLILLALQPEIGMSAARKGLATWAGALVPALFPYCFLAIALQRGALGRALGRRLRPLMRLMRCPEDGAGALICGWLGGNPTGAKLTAICAERGGDSSSYLRLALISSTCSPAFALGTLGTALPGCGWTLLISSWLGTLLGSLMLRALPSSGSPVAGAEARQDSGQPACEAARTMLLIGCWVVLFTVLSAYLYWAALLLAPGASPHALAFAHALLEMAGGSLALSELAGPWTLPLISFAITFGGLSITLQSLALLRPCGVPGGRYAAGKALQGALAALICALMERGGAVETLARTGVLPLSEPAGQLAPALAALALGAVALALNRRYIAYENADDAARAAQKKNG
ncbi:MAG: hypothetical protein ACI4L8_00755 [Candidatus Fimadaptatus sp.]